MVVVEVSEKWDNIKVKDCKLVDITEFNCKRKECKLRHEKSISDYMKHVFIRYKEWFDSDYIIVERQPICGLIVIQELIKYEYGDKVNLVSPNAMHKYLRINNLCYEDRKKRTVAIASEVMSEFREFVFLLRKHDLADSYCIIKYWVELKKKENKIK